MENYLTRFVCALLSGAILSWSGGSSRARAADSKPALPLEVKFVYPKKGEITRSITLPANVKAYQQTTLYAKVAGYLKTIKVDKGDTVKEGDLLARLSDRDLDMGLLAVLC